MGEFIYQNLWANSTINDDSNSSISPNYIIISVLILGCALVGSYVAYRRGHNNVEIEPEPAQQAVPGVVAAVEDEIVVLNGEALEVKSFGE